MMKTTKYMGLLALVLLAQNSLRSDHPEAPLAHLSVDYQRPSSREPVGAAPRREEGLLSTHEAPLAPLAPALSVHEQVREQGPVGAARKPPKPAQKPAKPAPKSAPKPNK